MGFNIRHIILFLVVVSAFSSLPCAEGGCSGSCAVSSGGSSSYNFMGDPAFNIGMSSFDEFVRDNIDQTSLSTKSLSEDHPNTNTSLNQTSNNASQTSLRVLPVIDNLENTTSDNRTVKLGATGMLEASVSTLVFTIFSRKF
jgi:hypothetical protein